MAERIASKRQFLELQRTGLTGNAMPSWGSFHEAWDIAGYHGPVMIRSMTPGWPGTTPDVPIECAEMETRRLLRLHGGDRSDVFFTMMSPDTQSCRLINAEVWDGPCGWEMHYSTQDDVMRKALEESGRNASGVACRAILRHLINENDWDDLCGLFDRWPGHVIELTAYSRAIGSLPHRRTVIWEIRDY